MKEKEKDGLIAGAAVGLAGAVLVAMPPPIDVIGGILVVGAALGAIFGTQENTKTNTTNLTNSVLNDTINEIDNILTLSAIVQLSSDQEINIIQPKQLDCKRIDINNVSNQKVKIIQTSDSETTSTLTTILNTKMDSTINQLNKDGMDRFGNIFQGSQSQDNKVDIVNKTKNTVQNTIVNSVKTVSRASALNVQKIDFNKTDTSKNLTCDDLKVFNYSKQDAQLTQMATLILNSVVQNDVTIDVKNDITQSNLGFLSDFVDALATAISKILIMVAVVAGVSLVASTIGLIVYISIKSNKNKKNDSSSETKGVSNTPSLK